MNSRKRTSAVVAVLIMALATIVVPQVFPAARATPPCLLSSTPPCATVHVWNISPIIGHNPDHTVEDTAGITQQVATSANPQTIITTIDNTFHFEGPCGLIFWNPATNFFKWYGIGNGFTAGDDLNRNAPAFTGPAGTVFGAPTFQRGDVWATINNPTEFGTVVPLYVNFKGSDNFRFYANATTSNGVKVDQATGRVYFTSVTFGTISRLDPATNTVTTWSVGGSPHYLAIDSSGRVYSAVAMAGVAGGVDAIIRIDPSATTGNVEVWAVPGGGFTSGLADDTPDGLNFDSAGNLWFTLSVGGSVARLNPGTGELSEFTTTGLMDPQLIASTGTGSLLQSFFTEGAGNAASILTPTGATPASDVFLTPTSTTVTPTASKASFSDSVRTPLTATIIPLVADVTGMAGSSGIVRFPMPTPSGGDPSSPNHPSGMTGVVVPNTIFGSYLAPGPFTPNSAVFQVTSPFIRPPPPGQLSVSKFFTDPSLNPLPLDPNSNPMVNATLAKGVVVSTNPGQVLAWINVTNTSGSSVQSLRVNETLPMDWLVSPAWSPPKGSVGAIHVFFANTTGFNTNPDITQPSTIAVSSSIPEVVHVAIPSLNATDIGHPLMPGQSILLSVKLRYDLIKTTQSASSYPRNYTDTASAVAWTQPSFAGSQFTGTGSAFFVADAKVVH